MEAAWLGPVAGRKRASWPSISGT